MFRLRQVSLSIIFAVAALAAWSAFAAAEQVPGYAEITSPVPGDSLAGIVTIRGTADHPAFSTYSLSFAFDPNPTGTWFPITEEITTPVDDGRLAIWDTSGIAPGVYQLRLVVSLNSGKELISTIGDLHLGASTVSPAVTKTAGLAGGEATATPVIMAGANIPVVRPPAEQPTSQGPTPAATLLDVLRIGGGTAAGLLALFGIYAALRPRLRVYLASLQNRRLHPRRRTGNKGDGR